MTNPYSYIFSLILSIALTGCAAKLPISFEEDGKWGLKDAAANVIVPPTYDLEPTFRDGLGRVRVNGKWGFLNHDGQMVIPAIYQKVTGFSLGLSGACLEEKVCGYINSQGQRVIPFEYSTVEWFRAENDNLAIVAKGRKWGAIRRDGSEVIPVRYDQSPLINDGFVVVRLGNKAGVLTTSGKEVLPIEYAVIAYNVWGGRLVNEGLFSVNLDGKWGFVSLKGEVVIPYLYDSRAFFRRGYANVTRDGQRYRIDKAGNEVALATE